MCWSGGKDSAMALHKVMQDQSYKIIALLTTFNQQHQVPMHQIPESLMQQQVEAIGLPWYKVYLDEGDNADYEKKMQEQFLTFRQEGISAMVFGDIFLEDIRAYRESKLEGTGISAVFPLWGIPSDTLLDYFVKQGFRSIICCMDASLFDSSLIGTEINSQFIRQLPQDIDPCGENGEYHSFCFSGPVFHREVVFTSGEICRLVFDGMNGGPANTFWTIELI